MKLPEDKKERMRILVMILIGLAAVLYAVFQLGAGVMKSGKAREKKIAELEGKLRIARQEIAQIPGDRKSNEKTVHAILDLAGPNILQPRLHNYEIPATEIINGYSQAAGVEVGSMMETGCRELPTAPNTAKVIRTYAIRIILSCGFEDLIRFLSEIEKNNPLISIADLAITGQSGRNPEKHNITFDIHMPIWLDESMTDKLQAQLAEKPRTE